MKTTLNMQCDNCGQWNTFKVEKTHLNSDFKQEPKIQVFIPHYKPLKEEKCKKCHSVIANPKELIRIVKSSDAKA
jgi:hypothetical protein